MSSEMKSRRMECCREFMNPDGTFCVELSQCPIHYLDKSGNWAVIDNNLTRTRTKGYAYKNQANKYQVLFAQNNQEGSLIRMIFDNNHWIELSPSTPFEPKGKADGNTIVYSEVLPGVDLRYAVLSDRIKEDIILNRFTTNNKISFILNTGGLTYFKNTDGGITFAKEHSGEIVFRLDRPYAEDSAGLLNDYLETTIKNLDDGIEYTITVSDSWLAKASYPVIIDPSIIIQGATEVDTFVSSSNPTTKFNTNQELKVGYFSDMGKTQAYIKFPDFPSLPPSVKITSAYFSINMKYSVPADSTVINLHQVTSAWDAATVDWNTQPTYRATPESSYTSNTSGDWQFNITGLVQRWLSLDQDLYGAAANNGIMLKAAVDTTPGRIFYSGDVSGSQPRLLINYEIDPIGIEDYWQYDNNVNVFNGNYVISETDVALPGRGVPINVTRTYNSRAFSPATYQYGYGWSYDVAMRLNYMDSNTITLTSSNGNKFVFVKNDSDYVSPVGTDFALTNENGTYVLTDGSGIKYYFNSSGRLYNTVDPSGNTTSVTYNANGTINTITDPSGRSITFNYTSGKLTSINGSQIPTIEYAYQGTADLRSVTKKDTSGTILEQVTYAYDANHNLNTITDGEGNVTSITYSNDMVQTITRQLTINNVLTNLVTSFNYQINVDNVITKVTDPKGIITQYTSNKSGNVLEAIEDFGSGKLNLTSEFVWNDNFTLQSSKNPKQVSNNTDGYLYNYQSYSDPRDPAAEYNESRFTLPNKLYTSYEYSTAPDNNPNNVVLTQTTDPSGNTENYTYDEDRNISSIYNPLVYVQAMDYNSYGQIVKQTGQLGIQDNLLRNTSFERWASGLPTQWVKMSSGGTISADTTTKVNGLNSVKLVATGSSSTTIAQLGTADYITVTARAKYNISWYVKTQDVGSTNGGATANVIWYDSGYNQISVTENIDSTVGNLEWIRKGARIDAPATALFAKVVLTLNDKGTAWFDNVQMEIGTTINQYNFVSNSSFESEEDGQSGPDFWYMGTLQSNDGVVTGVSHTGNKSLLVNGVASMNKFFGYDLVYVGKAGDEIYYSGWSRAQGVSSSGGYYGLLLYIKYTDGTEDWIPAPFTKSTHDWQFVENSYIAQKDYGIFGIYGKLENQSGQAWFDDLTVRYAAAGNALISRYNLLQNDSFEWPNSTLDFPDFWQKFNDTNIPGTYDISWIDSDANIEAYRDFKLIRISDVPSWATVVNTVNEPLQTGKAYTAYAAIKTENVAGNGAVINIDILNSSGVYLSQKSSKALTGTTDKWTVVSVSLSYAEAKAINANASQIRVSVGTRGATSGKMYFDMVRLVDERVEVSYEYTGNYVTATVDELGNRTLTSRDSRGNVISQTDPKGYISNSEYNLLDQVKATENPLGLRTEYTYDKNGNVTQVINKNKATGSVLNATSTTYNELGLIRSSSDSLNRVTAYDYDKNTNLTKVDAPNGKDILFTAYDNANRLKNVSYVGDSTTWAFDYDQNNNLTSAMKNGSAQTQFGYDVLDRLTSITYPTIGGKTNTTQYTYTPVNKLLNMTHSPISTSQPSVRYEYDKTNMLVNLYDPNNGFASFMHDTEERIKKSYYSSGFFNYRDYNAKGQITRAFTKNGTGTPLVNSRYEFDANGNITKETYVDNGFVTYEYDNANQLTAEKYYNAAGTLTRQISYKYEAQYGGLLGNRTERTLTEGSTSTTTTYRYDAANQLTTSSVGTYTFDANGNMTQGSRTYVYNAENQLIQILDGSTTIAQYEYNHDGLRSKKVAGSLTEYYYYDNGHLSYITDASNNLKYFFTRDEQGNLINMIDWKSAPKKTYWYIFDSHNNVVGLVDNSGQFVVTYSYSAFGEILSSTGTVTTGDGTLLKDANPFRYTSYQFDNESGFYYLKSRYYIPFMGRFLTRDVLRYNNRYLYCANNPLKYIDPAGYYINPDLGYQGEIHVQVLLNIKRNFPFFAIDTTLVSGGRADVLNPLTGAVWEVKPITASLSAAERQLARYTSSKWPQNTKLKLRTGGWLPGNVFIYNGIKNAFLVFYEYVGKGIIVYWYYKINKKYVMYSVTALLAILAILLAPETGGASLLVLAAV
jgi:RHS repeat-associated protein